MKVKVGVLVILAIWMKCRGQQSYVNNRQLDCYNEFNVTDGYVCNAARASCLSYVTIRPIHPYNTPNAIAYLLNSEAVAIAAANNISSDVDTIPADVSMVVVPVNCSCRDGHQHHDATYRLKSPNETYFSVANNTYQGLTACQALMAANPSLDSHNLSVGQDLRVPIRCACPTADQASSGVRFLLTYLVTWRDDVSSIAARFRLRDPQTVLDANRLSSEDVIFPFTTLLVPLPAAPTSDWLLVDAPPPIDPPPIAPIGPPDPPNQNKWIIVGVGTAAAVVAALALLLFFCFSSRRRIRRTRTRGTNLLNKPSTPVPSKLAEDSSSLWSHSSQGILSAINSVTLYTIHELQAATDSFSEANKIGGSVFRGSFNGDSAAVKVMKGDVSAEINILKRINHSNIIRLSGFCVHHGTTYLVYEYADSTSLAHCLHSQKSLHWKHRVRIAHGMADALNYLHNFADPPCVHKDLKSSNVLLDAHFTPKLSNFGLARTLDQNPDYIENGLNLTRHVVGTHGYLAPEYIESGLITPKLDVFAFGVILSELLSGRDAAATNNSREEVLSDSIRRVLQGHNVRENLRNFMDPALKMEYPLDLAFSMAQLAEQCVSTDLNARPNISQVFVTLSKIQSSTDDWDPSDELDHSTSR